jgi:hypothetical protein
VSRGSLFITCSITCLVSVGCTTYRTNEQIGRDPKQVQYATESHWWMIPRDPVASKPPGPKEPIQQDGYTQQTEREHCLETDKSGENRVCK